MNFSIGIISDTHSTIKPLEDALNIFKKNNVDMIICAGDIAGYGEDELDQTIALLEANNCYVISGNHDEIKDENTLHLHPFLKSLPKHLTFKKQGCNIYVVHASPPDKQHGGIKLLDQDGNIIKSQIIKWESALSDFNYDILIVGHTHQVFAEHINNILVINPGSTTYNNSCMILNLPKKTITTYPLLNKEIIKSWNWGLFYKDNMNTNKTLTKPKTL